MNKLLRIVLLSIACSIGSINASPASSFFSFSWLFQSFGSLGGYFFNKKTDTVSIRKEKVSLSPEKVPITNMITGVEAELATNALARANNPANKDLEAKHVILSVRLDKLNAALNSEDTGTFLLINPLLSGEISYSNDLWRPSRVERLVIADKPIKSKWED